SYMFPVGDQNLEFTHRPVKIDAYEGSGTVYVRCNGLDPELESSGIGLSSAEGPFDREIVKPFVGKINTEFFHNIYTKMPTSAFESSIYYYSEANAEFDQISNWNLLNSRWEALENHSFSENTSPTFLNLDKHVRFNMTDSNEIIALSSCSKDISTQLITPNNDDLNEYLEIKNALENNGDKIKIYNRWGNLVHEQSNYNNDWNGVATTGNIILESDDKTLPDGVYYFEYWQSESESKPVVNYFHIQK
ncbi:MAG: gliding motility-associated C-terminal domain-containing protein, partial [Flavobacteriales bacterium]|nr:gliding motility-associated C-terminal domain-containing protein [Flavobacteriales bacterium]